MNIGNISNTYCLLQSIADHEDPLSRTVVQTLIANKDLIMLKNKRVFDSNAHGGGALGDLPEWDLSDLYTSEDAPELLRDLNWIKKSCTNFSEDYEGNLINLDAAGLLGAVQRYEAIDVIAGRIMSFAGLRYYQLTSDPERAKFMSDMQDKLTNLTTPLVFYNLEFNRLHDGALS